MANLNESATWEPAVRQLDNGEVLTSELANTQAQQLANRTQWLKKKAEDIQKETDSLRNAVLELYTERDVKNLAPSGYLGILVESYTDDPPEANRVATRTTPYYTLPYTVTKAHLLLKRTAPRDVSVTAFLSFKNTASDAEVWTPMKQDTMSTQNGILYDQFDYAAASEMPNGKIVAVRVVMTRNIGTVSNELLGVGTGAAAPYKLPHEADQKSITLAPDGVTYIYDPKTLTVTATAPAGQRITVSYNWAASTQAHLSSISCFFDK